jgi:hypothetical protein
MIVYIVFIILLDGNKVHCSRSKYLTHTLQLKAKCDVSLFAFTTKAQLVFQLLRRKFDCRCFLQVEELGQCALGRRYIS